MFVRSAFSEQITKNGIEINASGVTCGVQITILCDEPADLFGESKPTEIEKIVQDAEDLDELDLEVAAIFNYQQDSDQRRGLDDEDEYTPASVRKGIIQDDDLDMRILDSIPVSVGLDNGLEKQTAKEVEVPKENLLGSFVESITVIGFNANAIPAITNLTYFMNLSFTLQKHNLID